MSTVGRDGEQVDKRGRTVQKDINMRKDSTKGSILSRPEVFLLFCTVILFETINIFHFHGAIFISLSHYM